MKKIQNDRLASMEAGTGGNGRNCLLGGILVGVLAASGNWGPAGVVTGAAIFVGGCFRD